MKRRYCILLLLLLNTSLLFAADIKFTASVSKTEVSTTEQFEITFSVNGNGDRFTPPSFTGFLVASGPNVSTSMTVINGNASSSMEYSYELIAVKPGSYTIGPASIVVNGKQLTTKPIKINVVKGSGQPAQQGQQNAAQQNGMDSRVTMKRPGSDISKSLFIRAALDKSNVYLGEQITLTYKLYTRVALVGSEPDKLPDLNGFYSQDITPKNPNQQVQWTTETYKGVKYNVANMKQTILFPEHAGDVTIDPISMIFVVREADQSADDDDMIGQFFGSYNDVRYKIKSTPVTIHVKPLPQAGKPIGFGGAVGKFNISTSLDKNELKTNEPLNYKIRISGKGNLKLLKPITPSFPADFEKYDPKTIDTIAENENGQSGSRTYTYLLIPRHEGKFTIDPVKFSYFDPSTGRYVSLPTKAYPVKVNKGTSESNVTAYSGADKQDVKMLNKDIRYIKTEDVDVSKKGEGFYDSDLYYSLLAFGPLLFLGALVYGKWYEKNNSDIVKVKSRKAGRIAAKHLASAKAQLSANNSKLFYENVFRGLYGYLSDKLNIAAADLNREKIAAELKTRAIDERLINELLDTLDLCDMARYAPVSGISEQQVFDKAKNMINDIENEV
ncbi:BatD family protein [Mucilaginibacter sabulilitoris]|uniref:BatD family protein n=1 Tax=Mucilaginibacter sabulilitoris TaxID=1173583 RepID=A0ABZ0TS42_9SPHI|nr:BatD family protein [Mucilaginibacter sabulilitoris]WPU93970.1 BatD family protein [Mucilaginibacter sabulilitoris]